MTLPRTAHPFTGDIHEKSKTSDRNSTRECGERDRTSCSNESCRVYLMERLSNPNPMLLISSSSSSSGDDGKEEVKERKTESDGDENKLFKSCISQCNARINFLMRKITMLRDAGPRRSLDLDVVFNLGYETSAFYGIQSLRWFLDIPSASNKYGGKKRIETDTLIDDISLDMFSEFSPFPSTVRLDRLGNLFRRITLHLNHWGNSEWPLRTEHKQVNLTSKPKAPIKDTFMEFALIYLALAYEFTANGGSIVLETLGDEIPLVTSFAHATAVVLGSGVTTTVREMSPTD